MIRALSVALVLFFAGAASGAELLDLASFPRTDLEIRSAGKTHPFKVWIADRADRQQQGLMFVRDLPADSGMLFLDPAPRTWSIWMKNTYIPLDLVFIGTDGKIAHIVERAAPHSLDSRGPGFPVQGVLELRGGEVQRRGLRIGDAVTWKSAAARDRPTNQ